MRYRLAVFDGTKGSNTSINDGGTSELKMHFNAISNVLAIRGGTSSLTDFRVAGQDGNFELSGGTMTFAGNSSTYSKIDVYSRTTLDLAASSYLSFKEGASFQISSGATVNVDGSGGATYVSFDGTAGSIINNEGTININGMAGGKDINFTVPVLNAGTLNVKGGGSALQAGSTLWIDGQDALTKNSDLDMTGGSVNLSGAATLQIKHLYTQTGGTFQTTDNLAASLEIDSGTGNANVSGGNIKLGTDSTFGELGIRCAVFNMSGEYDAKVNGAFGSSQSDKIDFKQGGINIQDGSTLDVTVVGENNAQGDKYQVIINSAATAPLDQFTNQFLGVLAVNTNELRVGIYELDQPS